MKGNGESRMRSRSTNMSEQYWRDRYGLPPRPDERAPARLRRPRQRRWRKRQASAATFGPGAAWLLSSAVLRRGSLLKLGIVLFAAVWAVGGGLVLADYMRNAQGRDTSAPQTAAFDVDPEGNLARLFASRGHDALLADNAAANEASLIALRGYVLTGSVGFKTEWQRSVQLFEASQNAIVKNSRGWTDGRQLLQLTEFRRTSEELLAEERTLASFVGTPNRFPGLRLYDEEVAPAFDEALRLCDLMLQSIMTSNGSDSASSVDALARLRGDVRTMRAGLALFLRSRVMTMPIEVEAAYESFQTSGGVLAGLRAKARPGDQAKFDRLAALIQSTDKNLQQIFALKRTSRWDYADYVFRQKVLPLSAKISVTLGEWGAGS